MIGQIVAGHEIVRPLGTGGMGEVYLARAGDGALRALKVVRSDRASAQTAARFRREVLALGRLEHPGIVRVLDAGRLPSGELYLAMEHVAGPDLQASVLADGPLAPGDAVRALARVAAALAYAHAAGVVHRDLKPSNVLLPDGDPARAKLIDFGLAKIVSDEGLTRLTEDQQRLGSPQYWAPEQSSTAAVGPAADVYALGGLLYFALSGAPLFRPRPAVALVYAHAHEPPEPLSRRCPELALPAELDALAAACVAKAPGARPACDVVARELERIAAALPGAGARRRAPSLFSETASDLEQALASQIRQVALELATLVALPVDRIERVQDELSEHELELAMLEADADGDPGGGVAARHAAAADHVEELRRQVASAFRALVDQVLAARAAAPGDAAPLYGELDELLERYHAG